MSLTLRTDYLFNGYNVPFAVAVAKGYYKDVGLNVKIEQGQGSTTTVQTVAAGRDDFGIADSGVVAAAITDQNVPVKMLGVYIQRDPEGFSYQPSAWNGKISALKGKTILLCSGCPAEHVLGAMLAKGGLSKNDVTTRVVDSGSEVQTQLRLKNTILIAFGPGVYLRVHDQDPSFQFASFSKYGITALSTGVFTSTSMLTQHPDTVRKFMQATTKGWEYAIAHPKESARIAAHGYSDFSASILLEQFEDTVKNFLHTPNTQSMPPGKTAAQDWKAMLQLYEKTGIVTKPPKPLNRYYDDSFIPTS